MRIVSVKTPLSRIIGYIPVEIVPQIKKTRKLLVHTHLSNFEITDPQKNSQIASCNSISIIVLFHLEKSRRMIMKEKYNV